MRAANPSDCSLQLYEPVPRGSRAPRRDPRGGQQLEPVCRCGADHGQPPVLRAMRDGERAAQLQQVEREQPGRRSPRWATAMAPERTWNCRASAAANPARSLLGASARRAILADRAQQPFERARAAGPPPVSASDGPTPGHVGWLGEAPGERASGVCASAGPARAGRGDDRTEHGPRHPGRARPPARASAAPQ